MRQFSLITDRYGTINYNYDQLWHDYCKIHPYDVIIVVNLCPKVQSLVMSCGLIDAAPLLPVRLLALEAHRLQ